MFFCCLWVSKMTWIYCCSTKRQQDTCHLEDEMVCLCLMTKQWICEAFWIIVYHSKDRLRSLRSLRSFPDWQRKCFLIVLHYYYLACERQNTVFSRLSGLAMGFSIFIQPQGGPRVLEAHHVPWLSVWESSFLFRVDKDHQYPLAWCRHASSSLSNFLLSAGWPSFGVVGLNKEGWGGGEEKEGAFEGIFPFSTSSLLIFSSLSWCVVSQSTACLLQYDP